VVFIFIKKLEFIMVGKCQYLLARRTFPKFEKEKSTLKLD